MSLLFYKDNGTEEHIAGLNGQADLVSGKGIVVQNGEVSQTRDQLTFTGTRNEWDSLSLEQKAQYGIANITDDVASGIPIVVDAVTDGDMNPVTSNAVSKYGIKFDTSAASATPDIAHTFIKFRRNEEMITLDIQDENQTGVSIDFDYGNGTIRFYNMTNGSVSDTWTFDHS